MPAGAFHVPPPRNEPALSYAPGSAERTALKHALGELAGGELEIPLLIGGREVRTGRFGEVLIPHRHARRLARFHQAGPREVEAAIAAALAARRE
jgi:1-pyrroline-5-carboxylate dehydrogenase